jgi:hypothetical protein
MAASMRTEKTIPKTVAPGSFVCSVVSAPLTGDSVGLMVSQMVTIIEKTRIDVVR